MEYQAVSADEHLVVAVSRWRQAQSDKFGGLGKSLTAIGKGPTSRRPRLLSMTLTAFPVAWSAVEH